MDPAYWRRCGFNRGRVNKNGDVRMTGRQLCTFKPTELDSLRMAGHCGMNASRDGWMVQDFGSKVEPAKQKGWYYQVFWILASWHGKKCKKHGSPMVPSGVDGKPICLECLK